MYPGIGGGHNRGYKTAVFLQITSLPVPTLYLAPVPDPILPLCEQPYSERYDKRRNSFTSNPYN